MITRNTLRADGLTVGQAMDRDAAQLRSLGIPARDGAPTLDERRDNFIDLMRKDVLAAMDAGAESLTGNREDGPKDTELSDLFPAIDAIANRIFDKSLGL